MFCTLFRNFVLGIMAILGLVANPASALNIDAVRGRIAAAENGDKPVRTILFLGNSYIAFNDMPDLLERIAVMHPDSRFNYVTVTVADGGAHLIDHLQKEDVRQALTGIRWDFVVLQEQSGAPLVDVGRKAFLKAVDVVSKATDRHGSKLILLATWPRQPGTDFYKIPPTADFSPPKTPQEMNSIVEGLNREAADRTGATVARVGTCWLRASSPEFLYAPDGSHPRIAGTYLSALVLYKAISGNSPMKVTYAPHRINEWNATMLRDLAEGC